MKGANAQVSEIDALKERITTLWAANVEHKKLNAHISSQLLKVQELYFLNQICDSKVANYFDLLSQNLVEARIAVVEQRKEDAKRLKKRYTKEMNVHLASMFYEASQQAVLPIKQRTLTTELLSEKLGVEMRKFQPGPYLEDMKVEIDISYPSDLLAIIAERKVATRANVSSSGVNIEPGNATLKPALRPTLLPPDNEVLEVVDVALVK